MGRREVQKQFQKTWVSFEEAITTEDPDHSDAEERDIDIGFTSKGRVMVVWYTERNENIRIIGCRKVQKRREMLMKRKKADTKEKEMRDEYDFSKGVRGKHYKAYRDGHTVEIHKSDGTTTVQYFSQEDGSVMLDPDIKVHFPDSESVNRALRSLIAQS